MCLHERESRWVREKERRIKREREREWKWEGLCATKRKRERLGVCERERKRERGGFTKEFMARLSNSDPIRENVLKCKWCKITLRLALGK